MLKPYGMDEFDGYPMPNVPRDRKPIPKDEEDKIIAEMVERLKRHKAEQEAKADEKAV